MDDAGEAAGIPIGVVEKTTARIGWWINSIVIIVIMVLAYSNFALLMEVRELKGKVVQAAALSEQVKEFRADLEKKSNDSDTKRVEIEGDIQKLNSRMIFVISNMGLRGKVAP